MQSENKIELIFRSVRKWHASHQFFSFKKINKLERTNKATVFLSRVFTTIPTLSEHSSVEKTQEDFTNAIQLGLRKVSLKEKRGLYNASRKLVDIIADLMNTDMGENAVGLAKGEMPDLESDEEGESTVMHIAFSREKVSHEMEAFFGYNLSRLYRFFNILVSEMGLKKYFRKKAKITPQMIVEVSHAIEQSVLGAVIPDARSKYTPFLEYQIAFQFITLIVKFNHELKTKNLLGLLEEKSASIEFKCIYPLLYERRESWGDLLSSDLFRKVFRVFVRHNLAQQCYCYLDERFGVPVGNEDPVRDLVESIVNTLRRISHQERLMSNEAIKRKLSLEEEVVNEQYLNHSSRVNSLGEDDLVAIFNQIVTFQLHDMIIQDNDVFNISGSKSYVLSNKDTRIEKPSVMRRLKNHCRQRWLDFKRGWKRASKLAKCGIVALVLLEVIGIIVAAVVAPPSVLVTVPGGVLLTTKTVALVGGAVAVMGTVATAKREMMLPKLRHDGKKNLYESLRLKELGENKGDYQRVSFYGGSGLEAQETRFGSGSPCLFRSFSRHGEVVEMNCSSPSVLG